MRKSYHMALRQYNSYFEHKNQTNLQSGQLYKLCCHVFALPTPPCLEHHLQRKSYLLYLKTELFTLCFQYSNTVIIKSAVFSLNTVVYQPRNSMNGEQDGNVSKKRANFLMNFPGISRMNKTETRGKTAQTSGYYKNNYISKDFVNM